MSPEVQREKIEAWATYRDANVAAWYVDLDVSGSGKVLRPEFERLMADARAGRFEVVAVYRLTRFARSVRAAALALDELEQLGVGLVSVTEDIDTTTAGGKFMRNVLFAIAEFEAERIGEEWRNVHLSRRRRGIAHVARSTFGFVTDGARIVGIDDAEARALRAIFNMRVAERSSLRKLSDYLEHEGFRPKGGGVHFAAATIRKMLANPLYAGLVRLPDGELIDADHDAIVPRAVWDAVQSTWSVAAAEAHRWAPALLSGVLVCANCGHHLQFDGTHYRCRARYMSWDCDAPVMISASRVHPYIEQQFLRRFDPAKMPNKGRLKASRQQESWRREAARLRNRSDELTRALDALADQRYMKGSITAEEYERQAGRFLADRAQVHERAHQLEVAAESVRPIEVSALQMWPRLSETARRRALSILIHEIRVQRGHGKLPVEGRLEVVWLG